MNRKSRPHNTLSGGTLALTLHPSRALPAFRGAWQVQGMDALLRKVVGLVVVTVAMLLAADARSAPDSAADMTATVGSPAMSAVLAETSRRAGTRAASALEPAKAPCPFCPKRTKTKACSTPPCPPASAWVGGPALIGLTRVSKAYGLRQDSQREGLQWRPDPPPPKS